MSNDKKAYNLLTTGVGYLNRLRQVTVKKGNPYWCASVSALYGLVDPETKKADTSYYDLRIVTDNAVETAKLLKDAADENKQIFVEFVCGDSRSEVFQYKAGKKAGTYGSVIKGSLLQIKRAWVEGELVIDNSSSDSNSDESSIDSDDSDSNESSIELPNPKRPGWTDIFESNPNSVILKKDDPEFIQKHEYISNHKSYKQDSIDDVAYRFIRIQAA